MDCQRSASEASRPAGDPYRPAPDGDSANSGNDQKASFSPHQRTQPAGWGFRFTMLLVRDSGRYPEAWSAPEGYVGIPLTGQDRGEVLPRTRLAFLIPVRVWSLPTVIEISGVPPLPKRRCSLYSEPGCFPDWPFDVEIKNAVSV